MNLEQMIQYNIRAGLDNTPGEYLPDPVPIMYEENRKLEAKQNIKQNIKINVIQHAITGQYCFIK